MDVEDEVGTLLGAVAGVFILRHYLRASIEAKLDALPKEWSRPVRLLQGDLSRRPLGFIFIDILIRIGDGLPMGMNHAIAGTMIKVPIPVATFSALCAAQLSVVFGVNIGRAAREHTNDARAFTGITQVQMGPMLAAASTWRRRTLLYHLHSTPDHVIMSTLLSFGLGVLARHRLRRLEASLAGCDGVGQPDGNQKSDLVVQPSLRTARHAVDVTDCPCP
eukprot:1223365-Prymnesium_polylepis.3